MTKKPQDRIIPSVKLDHSILILTLLSVCCLADSDGFARYQMIIEKHPFGEEPVEEAPVQVAPSQSFARKMRLSMLFEGPDGDVRAGIVDAQNNKSYILRVEQEEDGLVLEEANLQASEAMLRKGNEVALLKLEGGEPEPVTQQQRQERQTTYAERRQARMAAKEPKEPPQQRLTGAALRQHLEEVQMDAIRTGKPPLPMPLTPEMDAQLVAEGVLDPL